MVVSPKRLDFFVVYVLTLDDICPDKNLPDVDDNFSTNKFSTWRRGSLDLYSLLLSNLVSKNSKGLRRFGVPL
jgi:hypothetical protein